MNASEPRFAPGGFDLVVGSAILHHILDPRDTVRACATALGPGGQAIFFEPFEIGFVVLRILYEEILANRTTLGLDDDVADLFQRNVLDIQVRTGTDKGPDLYRKIDDKWLFTRSYFERVRRECGFSRLSIYNLDPAKGDLAPKSWPNSKLRSEPGPSTD